MPFGIGRFIRRNAGSLVSALPLPGAGIIGGALTAAGAGRRGPQSAGGFIRSSAPGGPTLGGALGGGLGAVLTGGAVNAGRAAGAAFSGPSRALPPSPFTGPFTGGGQAGAVAQAFNKPDVIPVQMAARATVPKGYLVATAPDGSKVGVLKGSDAARALGAKPRPKAPITPGQFRTLKTAARVRSKLKRINETARASR